MNNTQPFATDAPPAAKSGAFSVAAALLLPIIMSVGARAQTDKDKKPGPDEPEKVDRAYVREHYTKFEYELPMHKADARLLDAFDSVRIEPATVLVRETAELACELRLIARELATWRRERRQTLDDLDDADRLRVAVSRALCRPRGYAHGSE